jgi:hypothetical protein
VISAVWSSLLKEALPVPEVRALAARVAAFSAMWDGRTFIDSPGSSALGATS